MKQLRAGIITLMALLVLSSVHAISAPGPAPQSWLRAFGVMAGTCPLATVRPRLAIMVGFGYCYPIMDLNIQTGMPVTFAHGDVKVSRLGLGETSPLPHIWSLRLDREAVTIPLASRVPSPGSRVTVLYFLHGWVMETVPLGVANDTYVYIGDEASSLPEGAFVVFRGEMVAAIAHESKKPIGQYIPGRPAYGYHSKAIAAYVKWAEGLRE